MALPLHWTQLLFILATGDIPSLRSALFWASSCTPNKCVYYLSISSCWYKHRSIYWAWWSLLVVRVRVCSQDWWAFDWISSLFCPWLTDSKSCWVSRLALVTCLIQLSTYERESSTVNRILSNLAEKVEISNSFSPNLPSEAPSFSYITVCSCLACFRIEETFSENSC